MRALLSSIGTRGDVQPLVALGLELRALGSEVALCVAPNFAPWIESLGLECRPIGPDLEQFSRAAPGARPTPEQLRALAAESVRSQFPVLADAMRGCDVALGAGTLQFAARSVAADLNIPYVFAAYCPAVIPGDAHAPPRIQESFAQDLPPEENRALWERELRSWEVLFGTALHEERARLRLPAVHGVLEHIVGDSPWLAAEPLLGPACHASAVWQTGAWMLGDAPALPEYIEEFIRRGPPPVYFGFGSMRGAEGTGAALLEAARACGLRALLSRGWGNLGVQENADDCLVIGDVAHAALFPRVAAVVHHGGAGTTHTAARAARPQVLVPHNYDQFYWAHRVRSLGIGVAAPERARLDARTLACALREALAPEVSKRAAVFAAQMRTDGASVAASRLLREAGEARVR